MADPMVHDVTLRFTRPGDKFKALDQEEFEDLPGGEAAYVSDNAAGNVVLTRHINWKQSKEGLITAQTANVVFMAEILGDISTQVVDELSSWFSTHIQTLLNVAPSIYLLSVENPVLLY